MKPVYVIHRVDDTLNDDLIVIGVYFKRKKAIKTKNRLEKELLNFFHKYKITETKLIK